MQLGQEKSGMQTFNQALYSLYAQRLISLDTAFAHTSHVDELQDMIDRGGAAGVGGQPMSALHGSTRR
jgi:twitching motility protein PilT